MFDNKKTVLIGVLVLGIVAMTVAFAALSTQLKISGTASVPNTTWNIHFQNWALDTAGTVTVGGVTHTNTAVYPQVNELTQRISVANSTKVEGINVGLKQPGDYVKYTFQIINEGTIDASLDNFTHNMTCTSGNNCNHIAYAVECKDANDNNALVGNPTLAKNGGLVYCMLEVKYDDQTNNNTAGQNQVYEQSAASVTLEAEWTYIQKVNDNSQSGGNEQGNNEPTSTWDRYYGVGALNGTDTLNNGWNLWVRENTTTGIKQVCGSFSNGVACFQNGVYDGENGTNSLAQKAEFEAAGATCRYDSSYGLLCYEGSLGCYEPDNGSAVCNNSSAGCTISPDGTGIDCH